jgi:hypothetical protein
MYKDEGVDEEQEKPRESELKKAKRRRGPH